MKRFLFILFGFMACFAPPMCFGQTPTAPIDYSCWFDEDYTSLQSGSFSGSQFILNTSTLTPGFHSLNVQLGTDSNAQLQRFLFYRIATIPDTTYATTYSCWFDEDYTTLQTGNIGNGVFMLDVSDISAGFHSLNAQFGTSDRAQLTRHFFFKVATAPDTTYATTYSCWFDEDYTTLQTGEIGNGVFMLDVSGVSEGFHSLNVQLGTGEDAELTRYMFYKAETASTEPTAPITYTCWFDQDYEHRQTGTLVDGMFMLDVSTLSDSNHTLFVQMGEGENAQLISHVFWMQGVHEIQYSENIPHGAISISSTTDEIMGGHFVFDSATITIIATPGAYSILGHLIVDGDTVQSPYSVLVTDDVNVEASFICLLPDLQVAQVDIPDTVTLAQSFPVRWTLKNVGVGDISNSHVSDRIIYNGATVHTSTGFISLNSGDSIVREAIITIPCTGDSVGTISITTDIENHVQEGEESNNTIVSSTFAIEQAHLDMVMGLVPAQDSVISHGDILLRWNPVENATSYNVYLWRNGQSMPTTPTYTTSTTNKLVPNYENNQFYSWKVEAVNQCAVSTGNVQRYAIFKRPILTLENRTIAFGNVEYNATGHQLLRVTGRDLTDSIRLTLGGTDMAMFGLAKTAMSRYGGSVDVAFTPTVLQRSFDAYVVVQNGALHDTVWLNGLLANYYIFTASVSDSILPPATPVPITGTLTNAAHAPQANVEVDIWVTVMGRTVIVTDTTDAQGHFGCTYTPVMSECGYYEVGACLHGDRSRKTLTTFNIPGISFTDNHPTWYIAQYDTVRGSLGIRNRCGVTLHNVTLIADSLPEGMSILFDSISLNPFQIDSLHFTLVGSIRSTGNEYYDAFLSSRCTEGVLSNLKAYYYCQKPVADLQISFDSLACSVVPGVQRVVDVALYNNTDSTFNNVRITLPSGQTNIQQIGASSTYDIAPHDSLFVPLLLMFPEETPLAPVTGSMMVSADNTQSQMVPFTINMVSDATGSLTVLVSNEYTYYNNGPHVSGATVEVIGYYSLDTVARGITGSNGMVTFDSLPEGYYKMYVSAPENNAYAKVIQIKAGEHNFQNIDIEYQAITYTWVVYQVDMEDNWNVTLNTEFKTNVPKPVVTINSSPINVPPDGSFGRFNLVISNHGLIGVHDFTLEMPESQDFEFIPLYNEIDTIHALSSVTVPCLVRDKYIYDTIEAIKNRGNYIIDTIYSLSERVVTNVSYRDSVIYIPVNHYEAEDGSTQWSFDTTLIQVPYYNIEIEYDSIVEGIVYFDTLSKDTLLCIDENLLGFSEQPTASKNAQRKFSIRKRCSEGFVTFKGEGEWECDARGHWVYVKYTPEDIAWYLTGKKVFFRSCTREIDSDLEVEIRKDRGIKIVDPIESYEVKLIDAKLPPNPMAVLGWACIPCWITGPMVCGLSCTRPSPLLYPYIEPKCATKCVYKKLKRCFGGPNPKTKNGGSKTINNNIVDDIDQTEQNVQTIFHYYELYLTEWKRIVNDTLSVFETNPEVLEQLVEYLQTTDSATVLDLANCYDISIAEIDTATLRRYAERWNRTLLYRMRGWTNPSLVPVGFSLDFYYPDSNNIQEINAIEDSVKAEGYDSFDDFINSTLESLQTVPTKQSQCASVSLRFSQDFAMTREAFNGTLSIKNPHNSISLNNLVIAFAVTDSSGNDHSDKFDISIINREGIDTSNNSIAPDSRGNITVRFVPLMSAAPVDSVPYYFGGTVDYINPYTGDTTSDVLEPVRLIVTPSPHLQLDYFIPHDIISDDPLTSPVVESTVPATIGLRMMNDGMGLAKNIRISAIQPEIVENRLGLAVEFSMLGTMRNGSANSQPLSDISLGNLLPGNTHTLEYFLMSSLMGTLTVKDINVIHNSSVDDKDMSLVDARAHRLVKTVLQYGTSADNIHDFLTDDIANGTDRPDSLYFSDGASIVVHKATDMVFDHYVVPNDTIVHITIYPDTIGWNYGTIEDPGKGKYIIVSCVRDDSTIIPLDNIWLTFVDLPTGLDPVYVNKLHLVDTLPIIRPTVYNVTFSLKPNQLSVDTITNLPDGSTYQAVDSFVVVFNAPIIDSTFSYADMSLKCNNGNNLMDSTIVIRKLNDSIYSVNVSHKTHAIGLYVLKVMTDSIVDNLGHYGNGGKEVHWVKTACDANIEGVATSACESYLWRGQLLTQSGVYSDTITMANGCDSVYMLSLTINHNTYYTETITTCDSLNWHGTTYAISTNTPTITEINAAGCDSVVTLNLTINYSNTGVETVTACDSHTWHSTTYTASTNTPTYTSSNMVGCDSVTTLHLTVNYSNAATETLTSCDSLTWHGTTYTASTTTPTFTSLNSVGCDSMTTLHLTVNYSNAAVETVTACDSNTWHGTTYTASTNTPTYTSTNMVGCDSVTTLHLTVNYSNTCVETVTACDSLTWHGSTFTTSTNTPTFTTLNAAGCDSIVTLNLTVNYSNTGVETVTACNSYVWHGTEYTASTNTPTYSTQNAVGCDSVTTLNLTINYCSTTEITACDEYTWHGQTYSTSDTYIDGTDTLQLTIHYSNTGIETVTACDSFTWWNTNYTNSTNTPTHTYTNAAGCDSVVTLILTINYSNTGVETVTACDSNTWHGTTYNASTSSPTYTTTNMVGCDSVTTLHLTVNYSNTGVETLTTCDSLTWHGITYTASTNTPTFTSTNAAGCDSVTTLHLTVNYSNTAVESITACDSNTWHGNTYTASTSTPTFTSTNMAGCDSITTLNLTVNYSNTGTETLTSCDSLIWHGNTYTVSTTTPTFTSLNALGCDSITTLHLTVNYSNTAIETLTACDSLTWHDSTYYSSTLNAQFSTHNLVGCDSVTTLLLTINYSNSAIETITACDSLTWHDSTYTASTSSPQFTTSNSYGCDSVTTLYLTINYSVHDTIEEIAVDSFFWDGQTLTESGAYPFEGETLEGCDSIVILNLIIIHDSTFVNNVDGDDISLYPNPTKASVTIEGTNIQAVRVYSAIGQEVLKLPANNQNRLTIDIDDLPDGFYIFAIDIHDGTAYKKVVKKK